MFLIYMKKKIKIKMKKKLLKFNKKEGIIVLIKK